MTAAHPELISADMAVGLFPPGPGQWPHLQAGEHLAVLAPLLF